MSVAQYKTRGIVSLKEQPRVRQAEYEVQKIELTEQRYAQELRKMTAEVHTESIRADIAGVGIEIASNEFYKTEIDRDISEIRIDETLVRRDIASNLLESAENELDYIENRTQLLLEKWGEELRGISLEIDTREFENNNREMIAEARGIDVTHRQFKGTEVKGLLQRLLGGN